MITWPPATHADDVRNDTELTDGVKYLSHRNRGMPVVGIFLCLDGEHQARVLNKGDRAVMAGVVRQELHAWIILQVVHPAYLISVSVIRQSAPIRLQQM